MEIKYKKESTNVATVMNAYLGLLAGVASFLCVPKERIRCVVFATLLRKGSRAAETTPYGKL